MKTFLTFSIFKNIGIPGLDGDKGYPGRGRPTTGPPGEPGTRGYPGPPGRCLKFILTFFKLKNQTFLSCIIFDIRFTWIGWLGRFTWSKRNTR